MGEITLMSTQRGKEPAPRRSILPTGRQATGNAPYRFAEKKLSPNNGQSNGREDTPPAYIRSGADTPISDSVRPSATRAAAVSFSRAFVRGKSSVTTRHRS